VPQRLKGYVTVTLMTFGKHCSRMAVGRCWIEVESKSGIVVVATALLSKKCTW